MYGVFRLKPNDRNVRDLDIEVDVDFQVCKAGSVLIISLYLLLLGGTVSHL